MLATDARRLLMALFVMKFFQNAALAVVPPILVQLSGALDLSPTQAGGVIGAFGISRLVIVLPLGLYLSRISRATGVVLAGVGFVLAGTVLFGVAWGYPWLLMGRALVGVGHGMVYLAGLVLIFAHSPRSHAARMVNIWEAVGIGSLVVHGVAGGVIADRWGWRAPFLWAAVSTLVSWVVFARATQAVPQAVSAASEFEKIPGGPPSQAGPGGRSFLYALILLTAFTLAIAWNGVLTTLIPLYGGGALRLRSSQIATVLSVAYLLDIVLLFPAGRLMDRYARTVLLVPGLLILIAGVLLLPQARLFWTYLAVSAFFVTGLATWNVPSVLIADLRLGARQGFMLALSRVLSDVGTSLAPVMVGYLVEHGGYQTAARAVAIFFGVNLLMAMGDFIRRQVMRAPEAPQAI